MREAEAERGPQRHVVRVDAHDVLRAERVAQSRETARVAVAVGTAAPWSPSWKRLVPCTMGGGAGLPPSSAAAAAAPPDGSRRATV